MKWWGLAKSFLREKLPKALQNALLLTKKILLKHFLKHFESILFCFSDFQYYTRFTTDHWNTEDHWNKVEQYYEIAEQGIYKIKKTYKFCSIPFCIRIFVKNNTAWKVSVFGVILDCTFPHLDWIRRETPRLSVFECGKMLTRVTPNTHTSYVVR